MGISLRSPPRDQNVPTSSRRTTFFTDASNKVALDQWLIMITLAIWKVPKLAERAGEEAREEAGGAGQVLTPAGSFHSHLH